METSRSLKFNFENVHDMIQPYNGTIVRINSTEDLCVEVLPFKMLSIAFTFLATLFLVYIIIAISCHGLKNRLLLRCGASSSTLKNPSTSIVNSSTLVGAAFILVYVVIEFPLVTDPIENFCRVYHRFKIIFFALGMFCVYFALWFRIYSVFYRNVVMRQELSAIIRFITILPLPFLFLMITSNIVLFLTSPTYKNTSCGCTPQQSKTGNTVKWIVLVIFTTLFQSTLLFSFIYPICLHKKKMHDRGFNQSSIIPIVKRAAIVAIFCITSDLINSGFAILYKGKTVYLNHVVYSSNLLINLMGAILSFANWKVKLFIFFNDKKVSAKQKMARSGTSSSQHAGVQRG